MTQSTNFQDIMLILQHFWAEKGCIIWQPYHTEVGAGTMNPGTSLRVLGPEPWNVAYVEPSIRPDDGRYGENPNRLNQHYQFQVILKPDPGNPQEIYLQSLMALGIEPRKHDIRFVEDNWEYPALGAWGLGWEVWLDGLEITQFTYFQQSGGLNLDPVSVELTYGLERIAMALQGVRDFKDIRWNDQLTYGDVNLESEQEFSKYNFELADVEKLRQFFEMYEDEAIVCIENHQVLPAHDYMLKCSQTFNILDTRGAVGVTERQAYFRRMRKLARKIAKAYVEQRQRMEFPWLDEQIYSNGKGISEGIEITSSKISGSADFLLEIGTEELPPGDAMDAIQQLEKAIPQSLEHLRLEHHGVDIFATPRRLVILINELAGQQSDLEEEVKGPPAERAFDQDGNPTKAAIGFARSRGLQVEQLQVKDIDGGQYVVAVVQQAGESSIKVLSETLDEWIAGIKFGKTMRWNESNVAFSRPIRWLLAMHGSQVIPFDYAGVRSSNQTQGLRFYEPETITVNSISEYFEGLTKQGIILDPEQRKLEIRSQIEALTAEIDAEVPPDEVLLNEVTFLVEAPTSLMGEYEPEYLQLPHEVLVSVMKKHQRYFPVQINGKLTNRFITVRNGDDQHLNLVRQGNADVIRARFADAAYFVREDQKHKLEDFLPQLDRLTFQVELGSMLDKSKRITSLTERLSDHLGLSAEEKANAIRAAELCKADLATLMVIEMTSLQGTMGRDYALSSGEKMEVAQAIYEHYLPRTSDGEAPKTMPGLVVGIADRLDSLTGLFAAGLEPTGSKDPFAQRRMALGLVGNLIDWELDFDVQAGIEMSAKLQPISVDADSKKAVLSFIIERMRNLFLDQSYRYDIVEAVLRKQGNNPIKAKAAVDELTAWVDSENWDEILPAYSRCVRITRDLEKNFTVSPELFDDPAETQLYEALRKAELVDREPGSVDGFFEVFNSMIPAINQFFDDVLVMVEAEDIRQNRLGLLQRIADLADDVADFSMLEGF